MIRYLFFLIFLVSCGQPSRNSTIQPTQNINTAIAAGDYNFILKLDTDLTITNISDKTNALMDLFLNFNDIETQEEEKSRLEAIEALITKHKVDLDYVSTDDGATCLSIAVLNNDVSGVKVLLKHNAKTQTLHGPYKQTPLMLAVARKYNEIAALLYPQTQLETKDSEGNDHAMIAKKAENIAYLRLIKEKNNLNSTPPADS